MTCSANEAKSFFDWCIAIFPLVISVMVGAIAYRQYRTNKQKFRLDLYNRRFAVYEKSVEYFQSYYSDEITVAENCAKEFIRRYRESLFLFGKESDIYELLSELKDSLAYRVNHAKKRITEPANEDLLKALAGRIEKSREPELIIKDLEQALIPWLDFKDIEK